MTINTPKFMTFLMAAAAFMFVPFALPKASAQQPSSAVQPTASSSPSQSSSQSPSATPIQPKNTQAQRRAQRLARRRQRELAAQSQAIQPAQQTVAATAEQRSRDAKILAAQKAQSAATARENDALTQKVIHDQLQIQAEPRIQDAPSLDSQPLPGDPAIQPSQAAEPPRIQDAPGPAQTLPKPPPDPAPQF